jgi:hypothetical protein
MVSAEVLAGHVDRLRESFWPDDAWAVVPPRSAKEMEETRLQAQVWPSPGDEIPHFMDYSFPAASLHNEHNQHLLVCSSKHSPHT